MNDPDRHAIERLHDAFNAHDARALAAHFAEDVVRDGLPGRGGVAEEFADIVTRFPDARREIQEIVATEGQVVVRSLYAGTHRGVGRLAVDGGQMIGVPATDKPFVVQHIDWYRLCDGLITVHHACRDDMSLLMQLGLVPAVPPVGLPAVRSPTPHDNITGTAVQARNLATIDAWHRAQLAKDADGILRCHSPDWENHGRKASPEVARMIFDDIWRMYTAEDAGTGVVDVLAVDDCVIERYRRRVVHTGVGRFPIDGGRLVGVPATGRAFTQRHIHWFTLKDGLITDHRACRDDVGMMVELGLMPAPAHVGMAERVG